MITDVRRAAGLLQGGQTPPAVGTAASRAQLAPTIQEDGAVWTDVNCVSPILFLSGAC